MKTFKLLILFLAKHKNNLKKIELMKFNKMYSPEYKKAYL